MRRLTSKSQIGRYRHIAGVEQAVNVPPQEKAVSRLVRAAFAIGTNMRGLQGRQRPLLGDRAAPSVDICDKHPKCTLSEPRPNEVRLAKARAGFGDVRTCAPVQAFVDRFPQGQALGIAVL